MEDIFPADLTGTREKILHAALVVLQEHGYDGLSIKRIADEAGLRKSSVYHHYSDKDELLFYLLEFVLEQVKENIVQSSEANALEQLHRIVDQILIGEHVSGSPGEQSPSYESPVGAFIQVRAQAVHSTEYRERISAVDETHQKEIVSVIQRGIDEGIFRDVDPEPVASTLLTLLIGGFVRRMTSNDPNLDPVRDCIYDYIEQTLCH